MSPIHRSVINWIERSLGLQAEERLAEEWHGLVERRMKAGGAGTFEEYLRRLDTPLRQREELQALAPQLTVSETYFFRENEQLEALLAVVLPQLARARGSAPNRVWSVACSTGEEAWTLAMIAREALGAASSRVQILGWDANPDAIERARAGQYAEWALRATPPLYRDRYFRRLRGGTYEVAPELRASVSFEVRNIFEDDPTFWRRGSVDVVFCRNMLIYFSRPQMSRALDRIAHALAEDGTCFLGHSETTRGLCSALEPVPLGRAFCHRRAGVRDAGASPPLPPPAPRAPAADERRGARGNGVVVASPPGSIKNIVDLVVAERFDEASRALDQLERATDGPRPELHDLVRAVVFTNRGDLSSASACIDGLLARSPRCAGAHYLLGVLRENRNAIDDSLDAYSSAVEADPEFVMAHVRLGLLCRRAGLARLSRMHFASALALLERPGDSTQRLYQGGFSSDALRQICQRGMDTGSGEAPGRIP